MNLARICILMIPLTAFTQELPWTEQYPPEVAAANQAWTSKEFAKCRTHLLRLHQLLDGRGDVVYRLARVEASLGNRPAAMEWLSLYSRMGLQLADLMNEAAFAAYKDSADFQTIIARLDTAKAPVTASRLFATFSQTDLIPEDIAYDATKKRFYVSSVRHRKILSMTMDGNVTDFVPEGDWPILAVAADSARRVLWATTAAMAEGLGYKPADDGKSALLKFNLDSGKLLKRYDLPGGAKHALGDMTLSEAGDAYVSDGLGSVYLVDHQRDRIELLFGPKTFNSPQTPALSPDGRTLFVPDYSRGISIVTLATKETKLLPHPADLSLAGIDGLYLAGQTMVAIQNGTVPERLIRMHLDPDLTKILSWETIEANWKGLGDPTHGVRIGDQFYFIANAGWDVKPGGTFEAPTIRVMDWK
jgi:hypothetical protein